MMDSESGPVLDVPVNGDLSQVEKSNQRLDEIFVKVDQLEHKLNEVEQFYSGSNTKQSITQKGGSKEKEKEKLLSSFKKRQQDVARREASGVKRMQELMRQFGTIVRQITQHKWAEPFMQPVDVVGLELHDYYTVIEKPMDFSTIKSKMEAKDGTGYQNVREMCADVRLIFKNAIKFNEAKEDVHVMAKSLLDKFETKWLQLLPKVDDEEKRQKEEEAEMQFDIKLAHEASHAKMARELSFELDEVDMQLEQLRGLVLQLQKYRKKWLQNGNIEGKLRKMSTEEKKRLGTAITRLSPEDIHKAIEIIAQSNPNFQATGENVEIDIDAQSESTLWKLKFFVKDTLQARMTNGGINIHENNNQNNNNDNNNKRKREISVALAKNPKKRNRRVTK
ncbi:hypothetical protein RD792_017496 [Penstemon davidsonii]|uniref:Uncharacterized protein n=1 Tax=Penstemon davidsonii TaxID=160366 RepID=A0ABR0CNS4_9LAMI|nr:hypothetical protein RD792_017496 [Penstemon davidsonii]